MQTQRIAVIGGGISGLAAAHRVLELSPGAEVTLFEASDRLGGIIRTVRQGGFLIEQSADSFITNVPAVVDLCRRIDFADELISTNPESRGAMVVARGRLERVPEGFVLMTPSRLGPVMRSPILSWRGKIRLACEMFVQAKVPTSSAISDESLGSFARRRLGREAFDRLVQPLVGGIYTADPEKLSLAATLPRFLEMERRYGSLRQAIRAEKKSEVRSWKSDGTEDGGARYALFVTPRAGLSSLIDAIAGRLPAGCVRLSSVIERVERVDDRWLVAGARSEVGSRKSDEQFDSLILAVSSKVTAKLLSGVDPTLAAELGGIEYAGSAIVVLGYDREQIEHPLNSFGFVVPAIEQRKILSASFSSVKFPARAPEGKALIRVFLGGALQPQMLNLSDDELRRVAEDELQELLGIQGEPCLSMEFRWPAAMPQYQLGHLERMRRITERLAKLPGLAVAGNAYEGVGIGQCIRSGEAAAERVLESSKFEPRSSK